MIDVIAYVKMQFGRETILLVICCNILKTCVKILPMPINTPKIGLTIQSLNISPN